MNKITCPYCDSEDIEEISTLSSKEVKKLEAKIQKEIVKKKEMVLNNFENTFEKNRGKRTNDYSRSSQRYYFTKRN